MPSLSTDSVDYKWYLPTSTPSSVVASFVKHTQPRALQRGGRSKEYITAFARWYFGKKPRLGAADVALLLLGSAEQRGLIEACGALKGLGGAGELRGSSVLSLELLLMLLDINVNTAHGEDVLEVVVKAAARGGPLTPRLLQSARLDRHLQHPTSSGYALKLVFILSETCPALSGKEWVGGAEALRQYEQWAAAQAAAQSEAVAAALAEDDDRELTSWAQVRLDDLDAEETHADAALAELIAEVDAEGEKEGNTKDPLGIARNLPSAAAHSTAGEVQASAHIGKAAAKRMKILWKTMTNASAQQKAAGGPHGSAQGAAAAGPLSASTTAAAAGAPASLDLMHEVLLHGSTSTDRDDFNPTLFLSQVHSGSSLEALQRGLQHLQRSVNNRAAAMKALVAEHFGQYVFCLDTIEHLQQLMQSEVSDKGSRAVRIGAALDDLNRQCDAAFGAVIATKRGSDRMRETLHTLSAYRFLFALPGEVAQHAQHKQYAQVVRDYKKVRPHAHLRINTAEPPLSSWSAPQSTVADATRENALGRMIPPRLRPRPFPLVEATMSACHTSRPRALPLMSGHAPLASLRLPRTRDALPLGHTLPNVCSPCTVAALSASVLGEGHQHPAAAAHTPAARGRANRPAHAARWRSR